MESEHKTILNRELELENECLYIYIHTYIHTDIFSH